MSRSFDVELATSNQEYPNGFASVAAFIARDPDNTSTIYRRFDRLTARNLLYLQSKLQSLEATQDQLDDEDLRTDDIESKRAATSWEDFERLAKTQGREEREKKRMEVAEQIEIAIKKYHEALLVHSEVLRLSRPADNTLKAFKQWFEPKPTRARLRGHSRHILDDASDLVALRVPAEQDRLTKIVQIYFPWLFIVGLLKLYSARPAYA